MKHSYPPVAHAAEPRAPYRPRFEAFTNEADTERRLNRRRVLSLTALAVVWGAPMAEGSAVRQVSLDFLARRNFEAYCASVAGVTHDGRPIPVWEDLTEKVRDGWRAGAREVFEQSRKIDSLLLT